jgi:hypothetical protein
MDRVRLTYLQVRLEERQGLRDCHAANVRRVQNHQFGPGDRPVPAGSGAGDEGSQASPLTISDDISRQAQRRSVAAVQSVATTRRGLTANETDDSSGPQDRGGPPPPGGAPGSAATM